MTDQEERCPDAIKVQGRHHTAASTKTTPTPPRRRTPAHAVHSPRLQAPDLTETAAAGPPSRRASPPRTSAPCSSGSITARKRVDRPPARPVGTEQPPKTSTPPSSSRETPPCPWTPPRREQGLRHRRRPQRLRRAASSGGGGEEGWFYWVAAALSFVSPARERRGGRQLFWFVFLGRTWEVVA